MKGEELADLIIDSIAVKIRAMEDAGKGFLASGDVTMYDRLILVLGTPDKKYIDRVLNTEPETCDIEKVVKIVKKHGLDITPEEVIVMSKLRRFIIEKVKTGGVSLVLGKILDIDEDAKRKLLHKV